MPPSGDDGLKRSERGCQDDIEVIGIKGMLLGSKRGHKGPSQITKLRGELGRCH